MPLSPVCLVNAVPTTNGVDVTPGSTVSITLLDPFTPGMAWFLEIAGLDETTSPPVLTNVNGLTHQVTTPGSTVTFTFPGLVGDGRAIGFRSTVTGTGGPIVTTFGVYGLTTFGTRVGFVTETREGDQSFGWATKLNPLIRSGSGGGDNNYSLSNVTDSQTVPEGQQMLFVDDVVIDTGGDLIVEGDVISAEDEENFSVLYIPPRSQRTVHDNDEMLYTDDMVVDGQLTVDGQIVDATPYDGNDILSALTAIAPNTPSILGVNSPVGFLTPAQARTVMDVPSNPQVTAMIQGGGVLTIDPAVKHTSFTALANHSYYVWASDGSNKTITLPATPVDGDRVEITGLGYGDDVFTIDNGTITAQYGIGGSGPGFPWQFYGTGFRVLLVYRSALATGDIELWMSIGDGVQQKFGGFGSPVGSAILTSSNNFPGLTLPTQIPNHSFVTNPGFTDISFTQLAGGDSLAGRVAGGNIQEIPVAQGEIVSFPFGAGQLGAYTIGKLRPYTGSIISSPGAYGLSTGFINLYQGFSGSGITLILPVGVDGDEVDIKEVYSGLEIGTHDPVTIQRSGANLLETLSPSGLIVSSTSDTLNQYGLEVRYKFYASFGLWKIVSRKVPERGTGPLATGTVTVRSGMINPYSGSPILQLPNNPKDGDEVDLVEVGGTTTAAVLTTSGGTTNIQTLTGTTATSVSLFEPYLRLVYRWDNTNSLWRLISKLMFQNEWNTSTLTGAGPFTLVSGKINRFNNSANAAMNLWLPGSAYDGEEVSIKEVGNSANLVTLTTAAGTTQIDTLYQESSAVSVSLTTVGIDLKYKWEAATSTWRMISSSYHREVFNRATNGFRLTGVSGTPVMTSDSTSLSTIYLTPYTGDVIGLWDGVRFRPVQMGELSLAVTGRTTDLPFDIFVAYNSGSPTLEFLNWSTATARATAISSSSGVWTKSGDTTRRYVGTCRPRSATTYHWVTSGSDAPAKFDLWNVNNRLGVDWQVKATTDTWTYTTATVRQAQASTNYQVDVVAGLQEGYLRARVRAASLNTSASVARQAAPGTLDSTTAFGGLVDYVNPNTASAVVAHGGEYSTQVTIGRHFVAWLEISDATGTTTWYGDNGTPLRVQSGMTGTWIC
jgi:hypothetical protein